MSRGRRKTVVTEEQDLEAGEELEPQTPEEIEEQDIEELARSLELGESGAVKIYRRIKGDLRKPSYVETIPVESFKNEGLEGIKAKYGGGDYMLQFCARGKVVRSQSVSIDARFKGQMDAAQPSPDGSALTMLVEKLTAKESGGNTELMLGMMHMIQQSSENSLKVMTAAMQSVTAAVQAAKPAQPGTSLSDIGKIIGPFVPLLRDLVVRRSDPAGSIKEVFSTMRSARDLLGNGKNSGDEERESPGLIEKLLELAAPALWGASAPFGSQQTGAAIQPVGASPDNGQSSAVADTRENSSSVSDAPTPLLADNSNDPMILRMLVIRVIREHYPRLLKAAVKGTEPSSYFDVIADEFEDSNPAGLDMLVKILQEPNWCETLFGQKELPKQEWFNALRQEFLEAYATPTEPEVMEKK